MAIIIELKNSPRTQVLALTPSILVFEYQLLWLNVGFQVVVRVLGFKYDNRSNPWLSTMAQIQNGRQIRSKKFTQSSDLAVSPSIYAF